MFDSTITLGNILTLVGFLFGGWTFVWTMKGRIDVLSDEIKALKEQSVTQSKQIADFAQALVELARQDERLNAIDRRVEDMRYGRGFVIAREFDTPVGRG